MLKSFTVSNFKIFEKPVTIDFSSTGNYAFNTEAVKNGIVKTAVMYGKNASGKSSLGFAIFDIVSNLTDNYANTRNYINYSNKKTNDKKVTFEYTFLFDNSEVVYSYSKIDMRTIISEKLSINGRTVIEYDKSADKDSIVIAFAGAENLNLELSKLTFSALRFVKSNVLLAENEENAVFNKLYSFVEKMLLFWSLETREFIGYTPDSRSPILDEIIKRNHF